MFYQIVSNLKPGLTYYYALMPAMEWWTLGNLRGARLQKPQSEYLVWKNGSSWKWVVELGLVRVFSKHANDWIYHSDLGWAYAVGDKQEGVWLWTRKRVGFGQLKDDLIWQHNSASWLYLLGKWTTGSRLYNWSIR